MLKKSFFKLNIIGEKNLISNSIFSLAHSLRDYARQFWRSFCGEEYDWRDLCCWTAGLRTEEAGKEVLQ